MISFPDRDIEQKLISLLTLAKLNDWKVTTNQMILHDPFNNVYEPVEYRHSCFNFNNRLHFFVNISVNLSTPNNPVDENDRYRFYSKMWNEQQIFFDHNHRTKEEFNEILTYLMQIV